MAGCFEYRSARPSDLKSGERAAVSLSDSGSVMLTSAVGPRASRLEGRIVASSATSVDLVVSSIVRASFAEERWPGESVRVPLVAVDRVQVRRFDRKRSAILAAATTVGLFATRWIIDASSVDRGRRGPPPPTQK
jgi:hypothetical protein